MLTVPDTRKACKLSALKITHLEAKRLKMNDFIERYAEQRAASFEQNF